MKDFNSIDWAEAFARLHPVLLHLPIGLFVALAWLQLWSRFRRSEELNHTRRAPFVWLLAMITPFAAASGWLLHEGASYPDPVEFHEWFGIGLMSVALLVFVAHLKRSKYYAPLVWLGFLLLFPTAHFGGTLTHGEGFLTEPFFEVEETTLTAGDSAVTFDDVQPIFESRCTRCHGERKQRGGLRLDSLEAIRAGGDSGPAVVLGDVSGSLLLTRLRLPLEDDEHMPPSNKTQPTVSELRWIEAWIAGTPAPAAEANSVHAAPEVQRKRALATEPALRGIATLRTRLAHVQAASVEADTLWIDFTASVVAPGEVRELLGPLTGVVSELSLAGKTVTTSDLEFLAALPKLESLDLRRLAQAELELAPLRTSQSIRSLNLAGTKLTADSVQTLERMPQLKRVYLWGTGIESQIARLAEARPKLLIVGASAPSDAPLEVEPEVQFEKSEPAKTDAAAPLIENATCPVTDQPVDSRFVVLFEGRAIGFCCPNCPKTFWNDPQAFLAKLTNK